MNYKRTLDFENTLLVGCGAHTTGGFSWAMTWNDDTDETYSPTRHGCWHRYLIASTIATEFEVYIAVEISPWRVGAESSLSGMR